MEAMLWNKAQTKSVRASKIREFLISQEWRGDPPHKWVVHGYFNREEKFLFGEFESEAEARAYLEALHAKIEGKEKS